MGNVSGSTDELVGVGHYAEVPSICRPSYLRHTNYVRAMYVHVKNHNNVAICRRWKRRESNP